MKKLCLILLALAMCVSMCSCETYSAVTGKVIDHNGELHEFSPRDLCDIKEDDKAEFEALYKEASIKIEYGEVIAVDSRTKHFDDYPALTDLWYEITILGGWVVQVSDTAHPEASSIEIGDLISVEAIISTCTDEYVYLGNSHYSEIAGRWEDDTDIEIIYVHE